MIAPCTSLGVRFRTPRHAGFPACRACCAVLPPLAVQGRARLWCGDGCRVWAGRHPGLTRAGCGVSERSRAALGLWAGDGWEASQQPWSWPISWQGTKARARELLADTRRRIVPGE